jgi:hypothetical protein
MSVMNEEKTVEYDLRQVLLFCNALELLNNFLRKCQRTCRQLDLEHRLRYPVHKWFWPPEKPTNDDDDEDEEKDEFTPSEKLTMLRRFLRNSYFYCSFCSEQYKDADDLLASCPGPNKEDH